MKNCAARTGLPLSFLKRCSTSGCPAFDSSNRVDLNKLLAWIPKVLDSKEELPKGFGTWTAFLNSVKAKREEIKLTKDRGEVMLVADAQQQVSEAVAYYFGELDRLLREIPPAVAGMDVINVHGKLKGILNSLREAAAKRFEIATK